MSSYTVKFDRKVKKDFKLVQAQDIKRIKLAIQKLSSNPRPDSCIKLKGSRDYYRIRVENYRVVYSIEEKFLLVLIVQVGHRREIYR